MRANDSVGDLRRLVRCIVSRVPPELRGMRSKMMLEQVYEAVGVEDVPCPACQGTGWLDRAALDRCLLCHGFQEVPGPLADWFRSQMASRREPNATVAPPAGPPPPEDTWPGRKLPDERLGRTAERPHRVHLSHMD